MGCGRLKVACEDGFEVVTKNHDELVGVMNYHLKHTHQKEVPRDEIMKMAKHP